MHDTWQKRSKYQPQFLSNFQNWCYTSSLYTGNKKSKLIGRFSNFANPFIPPCNGQLSVVDNFFDFTNTRHVIAGKLDVYVRWICHIWIQYRPYIKILTFLTNVYNLFHLHPLMHYICSITETISRKFREISMIRRD